MQSGDDAQSQQDLEEGEYGCRVDCWNGAYVESKAADSAVREGQDWLAHNQELLHQLQVCLNRCLFMLCWQDQLWWESALLQKQKELTGLCEALIYASGSAQHVAICMFISM